HVGFERYPELPAVVQHEFVMPGYPCRAGIEVKVWLVIELAHLGIAHLVDCIAAAQGEVAPTDPPGSFDHGASEAFSLQFVGDSEPRNSRAKHQDALAVATDMLHVGKCQRPRLRQES